MITALLELRINPESLADATRVLTEVLTQTRAREGNLGVDVLVDRADPTHVTVVERWESIEADTAYRAWRATEEGKSQLGAILTAPPALSVNDTSFTL